MKKIAIYGKGGIGKSTTVSNVAAALAADGYKVMQIGCDPKADSTSAHLGGNRPRTVLELMRENDGEVSLEDLVTEGNDGVLCVECGGPIPGTGCAGRGIVTAFETLKDHGAYEYYKPDVVLYDVLGDVVCGGFAMPLRNEYARDVFIVTSGEKMALYAAANIALAIDHFKGRNYAMLSGLIQNSRNVDNENKLISELADELGVSVSAVIKRDNIVSEAEHRGSTVVKEFPESEMAQSYRELAREMIRVSQEAEI